MQGQLGGISITPQDGWAANVAEAFRPEAFPCLGQIALSADLCSFIPFDSRLSTFNW